MLSDEVGSTSCTCKLMETKIEISISISRGIFNLGFYGDVFTVIYNLLSYFFVKKKNLLVGASGMLWAGESVRGSVRDVCLSHQSDWIYY